MRQVYIKGVRESMQRLPTYLQPFITLLTGKALSEEKPLLTMRPILSFFTGTSLVAALALINIHLLNSGSLLGYCLLPISWVVVTGQLRKIQVVFAHHCVHRTYFHKNAIYNDFMLELLTVLAFVQNGKEYRRDHLGHHNREKFTTQGDADAHILYTLGFRPRMSRPALWRKLFFVIFTPYMHVLFLTSRVRSNIFNRKGSWRWVSLIWLTCILSAPLIVAKWWTVAAVVWVPMFILYNISALLQFITEHAWMLSIQAPQDDFSYAERCWGRFLGDPLPEQLTFRNGLVWCLRAVFIHAPVRFGCLVGDLPAHDWHHLCTLRNKDPSTWPTAIYSRQEMIDEECQFKMEDREIWGLYDMLDHVFGLLSRVPAEQPVLNHSNLEHSNLEPTLLSPSN